MSNKQLNTSHVYAGNPLDRGNRERRDEEWIGDRANDLRSKFLPLLDLEVLVLEGPRNALGWLGIEELRRLGVDTSVIFLGLLEETAYFAVDIGKNERAVGRLLESGKWSFVDARAATELLNGSDAGIVAQARAQINWHNRNGFCSICGHITVVSDEDRCLLGQSRGRLSRMNTYSALAGFVDQGESIEEAVSREVMEEAGITIDNIRYHSSQPWPFPWSLMIGCHADAVTTDISMDAEEMADVRWFEREEVLEALEGKSNKLMVPGPIAIAHHLIKAWATGALMC